MKIEKKQELVYLSGDIDESSDFSPLLLEAAPLRIDFSGVQRINSIGVRGWMQFLRQWADKPLEYRECPAVIVDQLSIIDYLRGIKGRVAVITSALLPTECEGCPRDGEIRVTLEDYKSDPTLDNLLKPCPNCNGAVHYVFTDFSCIFGP